MLRDWMPDQVRHDEYELTDFLKYDTVWQAGVQFKDAWIPAYAGMMDRYHDSERNNILADISGT